MLGRAIEPAVRKSWYLAGWSHEIDGGIVGRTVLGDDLVLFRDADGQAAVLEDRCCHRGAPLTEGDLLPSGIQCGYHGLVFDRTGACVEIPREEPNPAFRVRAYPVVERQHGIWVWMGEAGLADEGLIVDFPYPETDDHDFFYDRYDISANYMFMIDNLMDLTHLGYVHRTTIGGFPDSHNKATLTATRTERGAHFLRWLIDAPAPPSFVDAAGFEGNIDRWSDFEYVSPATVLQWGGALDTGAGARENRHQDGGVSFRLLHSATPVTDRTCHYFFAVSARGVKLDTPEGRSLRQDILDAFLEDKAIIEAQQRAVDRDPDRPLLFRKHDEAVAYARQAIHQLQDAQGAQGAVTSEAAE